MTFSKIAMERERITAMGGIVQQDQTDEFSGTEGAWRVRVVAAVHLFELHFAFIFDLLLFAPSLP